MKHFAFLMAVLVIMLSCMPCSDGAFAGISQPATSEISHAATHQETPGHRDDCSPFCNCSCCASYSICHSPDADFQPVSFSGISFTSYLPANVIEVSLPVWQPPQLV